MSSTFELRSGKRAVGVRAAPTAQQALLDYVRGLGVRDDEIVRLGTGIDHGDGTADMVSEIGGTPGRVDVADLTDGHGHLGFVTRLIYDE